MNSPASYYFAHFLNNFASKLDPYDLLFRNTFTIPKHRRGIDEV